MYLLAICDDDKSELVKTEQYLKTWQKNHRDYDLKIECFEYAQELLLRVKDQQYTPDLLLMDIYMPDITGIEVAKELRQMGSTVPIVFLTASADYALEAFGVEAFQYLVKPVTEKELFPVLDKILAYMEKRRKQYVLFRMDGRSHRIAIKDIVCCEAQGKSQKLTFADNTSGQLRMTMGEIFGVLSSYRQFTRVGASYILNLEHINSLNGQEVCLDTGRSIYLPRGAYQPLREQYFNYYCESEPGEEYF